MRFVRFLPKSTITQYKYWLQHAFSARVLGEFTIRILTDASADFRHINAKSMKLALVRPWRLILNTYLIAAHKILIA